MSHRLFHEVRSSSTRTKHRTSRYHVESLEVRTLLSTAYTLDVFDNLLKFDTATPGTVTTTPLTGFGAFDPVGLDFRPANGLLYGLGRSGGLGRLFVVNPQTGNANAVGAQFSLPGAFSGFDFNPTNDLIRVVTDADTNFRLNPDTGAVLGPDTSLAYKATDFNAGTDPTVNGSAYANNLPGAATTTLFGIDVGLDILVTQDPPSGGLLNTVGALGFFPSAEEIGFDILTVGSTDTGYTRFSTGGTDSLYTVDLTTGALTLVGAIGAIPALRGLAIAPASPPPLSLVVTNTNDSGVGSLRNAINFANLLPGPDTITFDINAAGVQTIKPLMALPDITDPVTIDGYTQTGATANTLAVGDNAKLLIELDGTLAGSSNGLTITDGGDGSVIRGLVINRFVQNGISLDPLADGCTIAGNFIGTDSTGNMALGNHLVGIRAFDSAGHTIGGAAPADRNLISGSGGDGLNFSIGTQTVDNYQILGNYIGTNAAGTADLGNGGNGILTVGANNLIAGNLISGNDLSGIFATGNSVNNRIQGNLIGTTASGNAALGNTGDGIRLQSTGNTIGGDQPALRNVISGNGVFGVRVDEGNNTVRGNYIGTDATGNVDLGNAGVGVRLQVGTGNKVGGSQPGQGNLISGNNGGGILVSSDANIIQGNRIGTNADGSAPLSNLLYGIIVSQANSNLIGGLNPGEGNTIAFTSGVGVYVPNGSASNSILSNSIFSNGALGIDLGVEISSGTVGDGPTPNDGVADTDVGGNNLQNTPELTSVVASGINTTIKGSLTSVSVTSYLIQFFADPLGDPSGFGEGRVLLGSIFVDTGIFGTANFTADLPVAVPAGQRVSATATRLTTVNPLVTTDTSEFSQWVTVSGPPPQISVNDATVTEGDNAIVTATFTISLSAASTVPTSVTFTTADGTAKQPDDYLSQTQSVTFNAGETMKTVNVTVNPDNVSESTETFLVNLSSAAGGQIADGQGVGTILDKVVAPPQPPQPPAGNGFVITDVTLPEGNSGTKPFVFTVTRPANNSKATVKYKTVNQTAGEGDYNVTSGTLTFSAGQTSKTITVNVKGDTKIEGEESFRVDLFSATGGVAIIGGHGIGKIGNDDGVVNPPNPPAPPSAQPKITIGDGFILEGNSGTKILNVIVSLSHSSSDVVKVNFATKNGTGGEGDYNVKSGTLTFAAGETSKTIQITVKGDTKKESDETFKVELSSAVKATILDATGVMTIKNDD